MLPEEGTEPEATSEVSEPVAPTATEASPAAPGPSGDAGESPAATGINPAWTGLRDAIGEDHFETYARPILTEMDTHAQTRITDLNSQLKSYEGYKPFVEQGWQPEQIEQAMQVAAYLDNNPEQLYDFLSEHLGKNVEQEPEGVEEPREAFDMNDLPPELKAQFDQMQQFQQQMQQQQQQQEYQRQVEEFDAQFEREAQEFLQKNPTWTPEDMPEIEKLRAELTQQLAQQGHQRIASLDEAAQAYQQQVEKFRARFGQSAPQTLPTSAGGNVKTPDTFNAAKASKTEFNDQIVADLMGLKGG